MEAPCGPSWDWAGESYPQSAPRARWASWATEPQSMKQGGSHHRAWASQSMKRGPRSRTRHGSHGTRVWRVLLLAGIVQASREQHLRAGVARSGRMPCAGLLSRPSKNRGAWKGPPPRGCTALWRAQESRSSRYELWVCLRFGSVPETWGMRFRVRGMRFKGWGYDVLGLGFEVWGFGPQVGSSWPVHRGCIACEGQGHHSPPGLTSA